MKNTATATAASAATATSAPATAANSPAAEAPSSVVTMVTQIMADTYNLVVKTHAAHWNVRGLGFFELHAAFEAQYQELLVAADELAERVRALGHDVPSSMAQLVALSHIGEVSQTDSTALVRALRDDHRYISKRCREAIPVADDADDEATTDLLIKRAQQHDKTAWMLSATLGT
jgi:starvation-inducible DNA-binding protein